MTKTLEELHADYDTLEARCERDRQRKERGGRVARVLGGLQYYFDTHDLQELAAEIEIAELGYSPEAAVRSN